MFDWLWQLDKDLFRLVHHEMQRDWLDFWMKLITDTGLGHIQLAFLIIAFIWRSARPYALLAFVSGVTGGAIRLAFGYTIERQRPSNFDFAQPLEQFYGLTSFPSGHATTSWAIAVAVAWAVRGTKYAWVGWSLVVWAALVAFSRVYVGVHYPLDILGGALLGSIVATILYVLIWPKLSALWGGAAADGSHQSAPDSNPNEL